MSLQQVAGSGPEPNWFSAAANSARTVDDLKLFNVAMDRFLTNKASTATRSELLCLQAACKTLESKPISQSFMQWVFGEKTKTEKQFLSLQREVEAREKTLPRPAPVTPPIEAREKPLPPLAPVAAPVERPPEMAAISSIAQKTLTQSALSTEGRVRIVAQLEHGEYAKYAQFVQDHQAEWDLLDKNAPPISYRHHDTKLPRSVTYVPGQGLMIHMKGAQRNLGRQQLGQRGGQGVVTKAVNFHTGAVIAFKSMDTTKFTPQQKQISHGTIVLHTKLKDYPQMFASGKTVRYVSKGKEKVGLFMPLWGGGELLEVINKSSLHPRTQLSYALQMAKSIHTLHSLGYLHRDLKLDNFFVSKDGKSVVLADFDMAIETSSEEARYGSGNLNHMAPETYGTWLAAQWRIHGLPTNISYNDFMERFGHNFDIDHFFSMLHRPRDTTQPLVSLFATQFGNKMTPQSEVFSFGVLLYEMKFRAPFTYPAKMKQLNSKDPYDKIILDCLALHPEKRPTMTTVISRLEATASRG